MQSQAQQPRQTVVPMMYPQPRSAQQGCPQGTQPQARVMQQTYPQEQTGMAQQAYPQGQAPVTQGQARVAQQAYPYMITTTAAQAPKPPQKKNIALIILGAIQIVIGVTCISIQIAGMLNQMAAWIIMSGIWCGVMYILSGSFGVVAGKTRGRCSIIAHMVLCILSAVFTIGLISQASMGLLFEWCSWECNDWDVKTSDALNGTLLALGLVQGIIAITASAMSCGLVCCTKKGQRYSSAMSCGLVCCTKKGDRYSSAMSCGLVCCTKKGHRYSLAQVAPIPMVQGTNGNTNGQPMTLVRLPMQPGVNYVAPQAVQGYQTTAALQAPAYEQTAQPAPAYEQAAPQTYQTAHVQVMTPQATGYQQATRRAQGQKQTVANPQQRAPGFPFAVPAAAATSVPVHTANRTTKATPRKAELPGTPPPSYAIASQVFEAAAINTSAVVAANDDTAPAVKKDTSTSSL